MCIVSKLLLDEQAMSELLNSKNKFTRKSLHLMQRYLQKDKKISQYLKSNLKLLSTGDDVVKINDDIINEVHDCLTYRYKKSL